MKPNVILQSVLVLAALSTGCTKSSSAPASATNAGRRFAITVGENGYQPSSVRVHAGQPVTLVFTRASDQGCGAQLVFPSLNLRRDLPLNQPVEVTFTPAVGTVAFTCGMNMLRGVVVVM